jgi:hypothetical protein
MYWECRNCTELHTQNPKECRNCGHGIFKPVSSVEVEDRAEGIEPPDSLDDVQTYRTADEPVGNPSPGVALDGSVARDSETDQDSSGWLTGILQRLRNFL